MGILSGFMKPVSWAAFAFLVVAAPATSETGTGDLSGAGSGREQNPAGAALEGSDAYAALLDLYIREHPDAARHPEFLPYFAGLGCKAEGLRDKLPLNPFEVTEIESAAQSRLDRKLAKASASADEPVLITFLAEITAGEYDMAEGVFPIGAPRQRWIKTIRPNDFCQSVAKAKGLPNRSSVFPEFFQIGAADEFQPSLVKLKPSHVVEMLGGKVAVGSERARAFYERGFPKMVVEVTGRVRSVARTEENSAFVMLEPVRATLRTKLYQQELLAVLGPEQLGSFPDEMDFDRDVYYLIGLADHPPPQLSARVVYSTELDASEAKALTGAITGAIGVDPNSIVLQPSGNIKVMAQAIRYGGSGYALVAGDRWRNRLTHYIESHSLNKDLSVIQIGRAAGAAATDKTSGPP